MRPEAMQLRPAAGQAQGALVLFHGRGADEFDLLPLAGQLDPGRRLVTVTPGGPLALPPGGRHWYVVREIGYPDPATFLPAYQGVAAWLDGLPALTGVGLERTVLGGFSQGCVMAWALSLGAGRPRPAGVIALSGFMPTVEGFALDLDDLAGLPVAIGHGSLDPIIGVEWGRRARDAAQAGGATVTWRESPIGHTIDPAFVGELRSWLGSLP